MPAPSLSPLVPVPFAEAIAWAKARQVVLPDVYYGALQGLARSMAFSIAGLAKLDQLQAVLDSLVANTESGESFGKWKKRVRDGEIPLDLPPHRLENIFRSNIQGHYGRGRCEQQKRTTDSHPWYMLDAVNDSRTRPSHAAMDGKVARHDDPWWNTHTPPNGFMCRCRRIALSEAQAPRFIEADRKRLEKDPKLAEARALAEPDKGWDYSPCAEPTAGLKRAIADRLARCQDFTFAAKRPGQSGKTLVCDPHQYTNSHLRSLAGFLEADRQMPPVRHVAGIGRLSPTLDEQRLFARFMQEFGGENRAAFTDVMGNVLEIDRHLFLNLKGEWKIMKGERAQWLLYTALNIRQPDEIWLEPGRQGGVDKRYYLSRFDVGRGPLLSCIAVFEREQERSGAWAGRTNYATTRTDEYIESKRKNKADLHYWRWER